MIISHKHKFIFIKTQKTAGTSIEIALSDLCGPFDIITPISEKDELKRLELTGMQAQNYKIPLKKYSIRDHFRLILKGKRLEYFNHMNAEAIKKFIGTEVWDSYFKFTFERNPYDKIVSLYYYSTLAEQLTLTEFIQQKMFVNLRGFDQYSIDGDLVVDKIYRFEDLEESLSMLSKELRLDEAIKIPKYRAKGGYRKMNQNYKEILSKEDKGVLDNYFFREIEIMNYKF